MLDRKSEPPLSVSVIKPTNSEPFSSTCSYFPFFSDAKLFKFSPKCCSWCTLSFESELWVQIGFKKDQKWTCVISTWCFRLKIEETGKKNIFPNSQKKKHTVRRSVFIQESKTCETLLDVWWFFNLHWLLFIKWILDENINKWKRWWKWDIGADSRLNLKLKLRLLSRDEALFSAGLTCFHTWIFWDACWSFFMFLWLFFTAWA